MEEASVAPAKVPWNKGKIVGQKAPLRLKDIWAIRIRLQLGHRVRELALFDLGLDSKLRACDLVRLRVRDICHGEHVSTRAIVMQQKTSQPVQFEITPTTREAYMDAPGLPSSQFILVRLCRLHPYIRTYCDLVITVPDGIRWSAPLSDTRTRSALFSPGFSDPGLTCLAITA
jgi:hypothetical protein